MPYMSDEEQQLWDEIEVYSRILNKLYQKVYDMNRGDY